MITPKISYKLTNANNYKAIPLGVRYKYASNTHTQSNRMHDHRNRRANNILIFMKFMPSAELKCTFVTVL